MIEANFWSYRIRIADKRETKVAWSCYLEVDKHGYTELHDWHFNNLRSLPSGTGYRLSNLDHLARWEAGKELFELLAEKGFVELRKIGPEDSEYFATDKLWEVIKRGTSDDLPTY